jgi:hypothetical protein
MSLGFTKSKVDSNLYFKVMNDEQVISLLYVDDLFLTGEEKLITDCKKKRVAEFEMKDVGLMQYFLGLEVWQSPEKIFLNQGKYVAEILKRFDMLEYKAMNTPMETKLKLLVDTSSKLVDVTLYQGCGGVPPPSNPLLNHAPKGSVQGAHSKVAGERPPPPPPTSNPLPNRTPKGSIQGARSQVRSLNTPLREHFWEHTPS